jgi:hypothetical protein
MSARALSAKSMNHPNSAAPPQAIERLPYFRFLDLPAEIREQILDLLLVKPLWQGPRQGEPLQVHIVSPDILWEGYSTRREPCISQIYPEVLRTCKQILQESLPILYRKNSFRFKDSDFLSSKGYEDFSEEYLNSIGTENIAIVEMLWLPGNCRCYPNSGLKPRRRTPMSLERLLEKHPHLCCLKHLAFNVDLSDHYKRNWA